MLAHARRTDDLLWSGTSFKEFEIWRERYPGGLSDTEHAFAAAMVESLRTHREIEEAWLAR